MSTGSLRLSADDAGIGCEYSRNARVTLHHGDCHELLAQIPDGEARLVVTSPPYNIGKEYERKGSVEAYLRAQAVGAPTGIEPIRGLTPARGPGMGRGGASAVPGPVSQRAMVLGV